MTTIAWSKRHGVLAADTLFSDDGVRDMYAPKIFRRGQALVGFAGSYPVGLRFVEWVTAGMRGDSPYANGGGGNGFVITQDRFLVWCQRGCWPNDQPFYAIGSGGAWAEGAMAAGASPEKAVKIAMRFDTATGGKVTVLKLGDTADGRRDHPGENLSRLRARRPADRLRLRLVSPERTG